MDEIKTAYYDEFVCSADHCPFTCCQQWKISIDSKTLQDWKKKGYSEYITTKDDEFVIKLDEDKVCPFLDSNKLCTIVAKDGNSATPVTCQTFPRLINEFKNRTEYTLDTGCPEVVDLINGKHFKLTARPKGASSKEDRLLNIREMLLSLFAYTNCTIPEKFMMGFYALGELMQYYEPPKEMVREYTLEDNVHTMCSDIREMEFNTFETVNECNELFLDIIENYRSRGLYTEYLEPLAKQAEELPKYPKDNLEESFIRFAQKFKIFEELLNKYIQNEIFANVYYRGMLIEDVYVQYEWIALEYVVIRQYVFLSSILEDGRFSYNVVREAINVISRVMGYETIDISEYMNDCFEEVIWEWGYLALITGNKSM